MNREDTVAPVYAQIALDIALRISRGELQENTRIYGRSIMASEYGVSPETIRRALKLLEDMNIVSVKPNSGAVVLSADNARQYVSRFDQSNSIRTKQRKLSQLLNQQEKIHREINDIVDYMVHINARFSVSNPFNTYEVPVPPTSPVVGRTLSELQFWQQTHATVIALRREESIMLSPGPYVLLEAGDTLVFIGDQTSIQAVIDFISRPDPPTS
ncbi:MAG: TrkA C-terminal domain-containing protein [Eubacteriales bacterium]